MKAGSLLALACCLAACRAAPPDELYVLADSDVESVDPHASGGRFSSQTLLAGLAKPRRDLAEARRLMALSAFPHGFEVDLDVREFVGQYFVPHLVEGLGQIGIRARVRTFADQEFFDHLRSGRSSLYSEMRPAP